MLQDQRFDLAQRGALGGADAQAVMIDRQADGTWRRAPTQNVGHGALAEFDAARGFAGCQQPLANAVCSGCDGIGSTVG
jgi:hypothetical protein